MKHDVIVIGAGISGLSSAYHIKKNNRDLDVAVIEKAGGPAQGNTGRATAGFRDLFSSDVNSRLASSSISFYRHVQESKLHDMGMHFVGYLFLLSEKQLERDIFQQMQKRTRSKFLGTGELSEVKGLVSGPQSESASLMDLEEVTAGFLGLDCGILEPDLVCDFYYSELKKMGVAFHFSTEVTALALEPAIRLDYPGEPFLWQEKKIGSAVTSHGEFRADTYVLANDVWISQLLDPIGIDSHMRPQKRQVFQVSGDELENILFDSSLNEEGISPFTILPKAGIHFRPCPQEKSFRVGGDDEIGTGLFLSENPLPEREFYDNSLKPVVQEYFPAFSHSRINSMWAGYYSTNTIDAHPFIFRNMNLLAVTGTSGSGLMKGDSIGRVVESLLSERNTTHLYNGQRLETNSLGVKNRNVPKEEFVL